MRWRLSPVWMRRSIWFFIDADKRLYSEYYDLVFPMVRPGGLILADNTLWDGKVVEEVHPSDKQTKGILVF